MSAKHTPGPWCWAMLGGSIMLMTPNRGRLIVLDAMGPDRLRAAKIRFAVWDGEERGRLGGILRDAETLDLEQHPDARLIAAAPDLLEAAKGFLALRSEIFPEVRGADACAALEALEAAIAKAEAAGVRHA